jgi:hypothetical protein
MTRVGVKSKLFGFCQKVIGREFIHILFMLVGEQDMKFYG